MEILLRGHTLCIIRRLSIPEYKTQAEFVCLALTFLLENMETNMRREPRKPTMWFFSTDWCVRYEMGSSNIVEYLRRTGVIGAIRASK